MSTLEKLKPSIKQLLADEGLGPALKALKESLPPDSKAYNEVILLESALKEANLKKIKGTITQQDLDVAYSKLRERLLTLLDQMEESDLQAAASGKASKQGSLLYQIPQKMEVAKETRCRVRIAYDEASLIENIELTEDTKIKDIRIAEVMEVKLIDPAKNPAFEIRTFNRAEQFVEEEAYTEWTFFVTPLRAGQFPLLLRVTVIEQIGNKERMRDIVLEESVVIVAEPVTEEDGFKASGYTVGGEEDIPPSKPQNTRVLRSMAMGLVMLIGLSTISYATIPSVRLEVDWALTAMRDTEEAYESFVEKYKGKTRSARGMEKVEAGDWEIVKRDTSQLALEEYLVEYPKGTFFDKAVLRLLDRKAYQPIQTPTRDVLQDYLKEKEKVDIPEQKRLQLDRIITPIDNRKKIQDQLKTQESPDLGIREKVETPREKVTEAVTSKSDLNKEGLKDAPIMNRVKEKKEEVIDRRTIPIPEMVFVKGGTFRMGCTEEQGEDCSDFAKPAHEVTVKDFFIGKYEVTNEEFAAFLNAKGNQIEGGIAWFQPSIYSMIEKAGQRFQAKQGFEKHPVTFVSWYGAVAYCEWLSEYTGKRYQLPSEAQWEYAARGGIKSKGFKFSGGDHLKEVGFYNENSTDIVFKVGGKKANELGVFDMSGNASEWCGDTWHSSYNGAPPNGSCWQEGVDENRRVTRGGSWYAKENFCRVSSRGRLDKSFRINNLGFRVARY